MTPEEQAIKLAFDAFSFALKLADHFGQRAALKARLRAEMSDMFDDAEEALERKHARTRDTEPPGDA